MTFLTIIPLFFLKIWSLLYWLQNVEFSFACLDCHSLLLLLFYFFLNPVKSRSPSTHTSVMSSLISVMFLRFLIPWPGNLGIIKEIQGRGLRLSVYWDHLGRGFLPHSQPGHTQAAGPAGGCTPFMPSWPWGLIAFALQQPWVISFQAPAACRMLGTDRLIFYTLGMYQPPFFPYPECWKTPLSSAVSPSFSTFRKKKEHLSTLWFHKA